MANVKKSILPLILCLAACSATIDQVQYVTKWESSGVKYFQGRCMVDIPSNQNKGQWSMKLTLSEETSDLQVNFHHTIYVYEASIGIFPYKHRLQFLQIKILILLLVLTHPQKHQLKSLINLQLKRGTKRNNYNQINCNCQVGCL